MTVLRTTFRAALYNLIGPTIVSWVLVVLALEAAPPLREAALQQEATTALSVWLHLPAMLLSLATIATILESWPLFGRDRDGTKLLYRVVPGPLKGCGAACLGGLSALAIALTVTAIAFTFTLDRADWSHEVHPVVSVETTATPAWLRPGQAQLRYGLPDRAIVQVRLRPLIDVVESRLTLLLDGRALTADAVVVESGRWFELDFEPRRGTVLEIRSAVEGDQCRFDAGTVEVMFDASHPAWLNSIWAVLTYLIPVSLACGLMCLGRRTLSHPIALVLGFGLVVACTVGDLTPNSAAVAAHARDRWILSEGLGLWGLTTLSCGAFALVLAALARGRDRT